MRTCTCINCNANLTFDDNNREFVFCQYCGAKIMLDDYRSTHRIVDEAKIKQVETEQIIRLRELELEEKEKERTRKGYLIAYGIAAGCCAIGALICIFDFFVGIWGFLIGVYIAMFTFIKSEDNKKNQKENQYMRSGMVKLSSSAANYEDKDYRSIESAFKCCGFINVRTVNMRDLKMGIFYKPNIVQEVTINGDIPKEGEWYNPNSVVVITYHGFG